MLKELIRGAATVGILFLLFTISGCNDPSSYVDVTESSDPSVQSKQTLAEATGGAQTLSVSIATGNDDAEQSVLTGYMNLGSSDLELTEDAADGGGEQIIGLRFVGIALPEGAIINSAHIQFEVDEVSADATLLLIEGENTDTAAPFQDIPNNISARNRTGASVSWNPPAWNTLNERGSDQQTPDLASVVQEVISRPSWDSNSLAFIISGTGKRVVKSFEKGVGVATLHIEYSIDTGTTPEITSPAPNSTLSGTTATLEWTANTTNVSQWWLYVGSSQGASDILNSGLLAASPTSYTVTDLPVDGRTVYVKLWYKKDGSGNWKTIKHTYQAYTDLTNTGLVINEFMAANSNTLATAGGKYEDWIELKNNGSSTVSLENWCLTDDAANPAQWCFPDISIAAGNYLVVFASKDNITTGSELHTNFKLGKSGEYLGLIKPDGTVADEYSATYPPQINDVSYGVDNSGNKRYFPTPTPSVSNNAGVVDLLEFANDSISLSGTASIIEVSLGTLAGSNISYTLTTEDGNAGWLSAVSGTGEDGITSDQVMISASLTGLTEGTYNGTVTASAAGYQSSSINVTLSVGAGSTSNIVINEVLAANVDTNLDPDRFEFSDWIELYNNSSQNINIGGYYLSDDPNLVTKWQIPVGTILEAGKYLLIWADETDQGLHTNFNLSDSGETITLAEADGTVIDTLVYEELKTDISCAKATGGIIVYMDPTPGAVNSAPFGTLSRSKKPDFSVSEGFYNGSQAVSLSQVNGGQIYYTIDGTTPTTASSLYSQPITVNSTTVIRARAYENDKVKSKVRTKTYLIGVESTLPVVSIAMNSDYLFDNTVGIHVAGTNGRASYGCYGRTDNTDLTQHKNFNQEWKRPVLIEYFDASNQKVFNLGAGISISGQCSRYENKKSLSLELSGKYGDKSLQYSFYQSKLAVNKIKDFKLRTGYTSNDILSSLLVTAGSFNIDYQGYQAARIFINGEYWGVYNIREKKGKDYLKSNYPSLGEVDIIAHNLYGDDVKEGNIDAFNVLFDYINTHDLSVTANYQALLEMIDEDNYIDYMVLMIYSGNGDWLWNNNRWWRERIAGAKWRWMLDDLDAAFKDPNTDTFGFIMDPDKDELFMTRLFKGLLTNSTFKQKFKDRFNAQLDTVFLPVNVKALINSTSVERRNYIEGGRWNESQEGHDYGINVLNNFADGRANYIRAQLNNL